MTTDKAATPVLCDLRTWVQHTVMFHLDSPGDVMPTADGKWGRLTAVTIELYSDRDPRVWAGGRRCRKDGEPDGRMGNVTVSLVLADPDVWIERARQAVRDE